MNKRYKATTFTIQVIRFTYMQIQIFLLLFQIMSPSAPKKAKLRFPLKAYDRFMFDTCIAQVTINFQCIRLSTLNPELNINTYLLFQKHWSEEEKEERWKQHSASALKAAKRSKKKEKHATLTRCQKKNKKARKKKKRNKSSR